ncbi:MAG: ketopantoate reductase family protein [Betaproteobacteria bacterium]|jgi:2-dehydropantoate 2-reductase|nr:MAG: ketopantoate reductase family protein [Betaproteobacteria bacterium]
MRFVIIGAGALGSIYAAYLARGGYQVSLIARGERAAALAKHGIPVTGKESFTARCNIVTQPEKLTEADVVIVSVKTYDTEGALAPVRALKTRMAFSVQNGVLKNELLGEVFGARSTLGALSMVGGDVLPAQGDLPGAVRYNMAGPTIIGETGGGESARAKGIVGAFVQSGLKAEVSQDITSAEWSKFVGWSGFSALAILTRLPTWRFMADTDTALIAARVMRETAQVAMRQGVKLQDSGFSSREFVNASEDGAVKAVQAYGEMMKKNAPGFRQSILQDADRQRRLEVNETLGYTLKLAAQIGVATPTLDLCCRVLRVVSRAADS